MYFSLSHFTQGFLQPSHSLSPIFSIQSQKNLSQQHDKRWRTRRRKRRKITKKSEQKKIHAEIRSIRFFMPCVRVCVSEFCRMYLWVSRIEFCCGIFLLSRELLKFQKKNLKNCQFLFLNFSRRKFQILLMYKNCQEIHQEKNVSCLSRCSQSCLNCCCCCIDNKKLMKIDWKKFFNQPQNSKRDFVFFVVNVFFLFFSPRFFLFYAFSSHFIYLGIVKGDVRRRRRKRRTEARQKNQEKIEREKKKWVWERERERASVDVDDCERITRRRRIWKKDGKSLRQGWRWRWVFRDFWKKKFGNSINKFF